MIIFLQISLRKARLGIVISKSGISQVQSLSRSDTRVERPCLAALLPLQAECDGLNKHIHSLASQMYQNLKLHSVPRTGIRNDAGIVCDQGTESTRVGRLEVVVEAVVSGIAIRYRSG
jgi:hypothetical protein